jgi:hypothetical protein
MNTKTILHAGVIGAGRIGKIHTESLARYVPGATVAAIADINLAAAQETASRLSIPKVMDDYRAILADPEIDIVVICSSTDTHARLIIEAAEAGKHIFCEKPIDHNLASIEECRRPAPDRFQSPFRCQFPPGARGGSLWSNRYAAHPAYHQPRSCPTTHRVCESFRWDFPGYDHTRFRYGPLPDGQ